MTNTLLLLAGLGLILAGASFLTDGAAALAKRLRMPEFVIGLTIVAVGTSTPELAVSLLSALGGQGGMAIGNVVGSNVFNTLVILGVCALIRPLPLSRENVRRDIPLGIGAALLLLLLTSDDLLGTGPAPRIGRAEGMLMLLLYAAMTGYSIRAARRRAEPAAEASPGGDMRLAAVMIIGGLGGLIFGGNLFLDSAVAIARTLGVSESTIAITLVAGGTSLPELASAAVSLLKGKSQMALGNILGSNAANILLILGASASVTPLTMEGITRGDLAMTLLCALLPLLASFGFRRGSIDRAEGAIFLLLYALYMGKLLL